MVTKRASLTLAGVTLAAFAATAFTRLALPQASTVAVYKSPSCGCCAKWVEHMKGAGFTVEVHDTDDVARVKNEHHVPEALRSCHTALVNGHVIEGHVPADLVQKFIKERPKLVGLAVPGMVAGSPGMEGATKQAYDVVAFDPGGKTTVYAKR